MTLSSRRSHRASLARSYGLAAFLLAAVSLFVGAAAPAAGQSPIAARADPALMEISDADTTIYLFGTIHLLPEGLVWFDGPVRDAFNRSEDIFLEALLPDDPAALAPLIRNLAVDPAGRTISSRLSRRQRKAVEQGLGALDIPLAAIDPLEPWYAGLQVASSVAAAAGFSSASGVEAVLEREAQATGKNLQALESAEQQLRILDSTPETEQVAGLVRMLADPERAKQDLLALLASWAQGDLSKAAALLNAELASSPETARLLLADRNRRWADLLVARMARPGYVFVAVGAGHLAGSDSLAAMLEERGHRVTRRR
jgi:hypothetical protein